MPRVIHFEIQCTNPEAASRFYAEAFGWSILKKKAGTEDYWLIRTGTGDEPGINGGIRKPLTGSISVTVNTVEVVSLDDSLKRIERLGGKIAAAKKLIPGTGTLAYCFDPEGNLFALLEKSG